MTANSSATYHVVHSIDPLCVGVRKRGRAVSPAVAKTYLAKAYPGVVFEQGKLGDHEYVVRRASVMSTIAKKPVT